MIRKYRTKELLDLELQMHPDDKETMLLYINGKEFIVKDNSFYMDFADNEVSKINKELAEKQALDELGAETPKQLLKEKAARIFLELMKDAAPVRFEYTILVGDNYRNMKDILKSLED